MSYEFNPESQIFEFPNPYKVENLAIMMAGSVMALAGAWSLFAVRARIAEGFDSHALAVIAIAIALLVFGIGLLGRAFTQLRFFFGRSLPIDLAPGIAQDKDGDSERARFYKETLRQNAIKFAEPKGALNGLLYSWIPHLIFAPRVVQESAQTQFYNFLTLLATLLSFLFCWLMFGQGPANAWIGLIYGVFVIVHIVRPMLSNTTRTVGAITETADVGIGGLVGLIVFAVLGPVILGASAAHLPHLGDLSINQEVLITLLCALAGSGIFGLALKNQLQAPPQAVGAARVTETLTMNAHPNKLVEELDRILMTRWFGNIPNRRYTRRSPEVSGRQGQFSAELFEETQPRPQANRTATGVAHALATPQFFWLACLTGLATIFLLMGTAAAMLTTQKILAGVAFWSSLAFTVSQFAVGMFCYRAAHVLWGRFDFVSELIWVDITGSFESAQVQVGNQLSGNIHTSKNVINIESMTMRVWVSEIDTVIFGKDAARQLIGMRGLQTTADELAENLKHFGETRSMIVAPTSANDLERAKNVGTLNQLVAGVAGAAATPDVAAIVAAVSSTPISAGTATSLTHAGHAGDISTVAKRFCTQCGASMTAEAAFCSACGKAAKA